MSKPIAPLMWVDEWGCINTMQPRAAQRFLTEFFNSWPGGLREIESSLAGHKKIIEQLKKTLRNLGYSKSEIENLSLGK